jgi:hypothetical protein
LRDAVLFIFTQSSTKAAASRVILNPRLVKNAAMLASPGIPAKRHTPTGGEAGPAASPVCLATKADHFFASSFFLAFASCSGVAISASAALRLRTLARTVADAFPGIAAEAIAAGPNAPMALMARRCSGEA